MKNNNGKVAIAIVAMFVVALSVVGFTYAYFTAQVQENKEDTSVEVGAGIMQVDYDFGQKLTARNIVPGWISDEHHYYDPLLSVDDKDGIRKISAATLDTGKVLKTGSGLTVAPKYDDANPLVAKPVSFTVKNTGTEVAKYAINLNITAVETDKQFDVNIDGENLVVYLFKGTWDGNLIAEATLENPILLSETVEGTKQWKTVVELDAFESLAVSASQPYYVVLQYKNNPNASQNNSMDKVFQAKVEVVGLGQDATE